MDFSITYLETKYVGLPKNVKYTYYSILNLHAQFDEIYMVIGSHLGLHYYSMPRMSDI